MSQETFLQAIRESEIPPTMNEIVELTGLSASSCRGNKDRLLKHNEIVCIIVKRPKKPSLHRFDINHDHPWHKEEGDGHV